MSSSSLPNLPTALTVTVAPSQSAFFAGEVFTAQITFTNAAPPDTSLIFRQEYNNAYTQSSVAVGGNQTSGGRPPLGARSTSHGEMGTAQYAAHEVEEGEDGLPISPLYDLSPGAGSRAQALRSSGGRANSVAELSPARRAAASPRSALDAGARPSIPLASRPGTRKTVLPPPPPSSNPSLRSLVPARRGLIGKPLESSLTSPIYDTFRNRTGSYTPGASPPVGSSGAVPAETSGVASFAGEDPARSPRHTSDTANRKLPRIPSTDHDSHGTTSPGRAPPLVFSSPTPRRRPEALAGLRTGDFSSTVSLANSDDYDENDEQLSAAAVRAREFYRGGQNIPMDELMRARLDERARNANWKESPRSAGAGTTAFQRRTASISGMAGRPAPTIYSPPPPKPTNFMHPPNTLLLLWSFVHLEGTFEVEESLIRGSEFNDVKRSLLAGFGSGLGGGNLGELRDSPGWKHWLWGSDTDRTTAGASLEERKTSMMSDHSVPTFSSPPSILGIDLVLEPGESKTYTFSIPIPADLPPSFRGKAIKFSYSLVLGTNQSALDRRVSPAAQVSSSGAISRLMKVPVRVYNHVAVTGARPFYDLTNPIVYHRDEATIIGDDVKLAARQRRPSTGRQDFEDYASSLLDSVQEQILLPTLVGTGPPPSPALRLRENSIPMSAEASLRPEMRARTSTGSVMTLRMLNPPPPEEDEIVGCKAAVEIVSRNSKKVSYDINKDGYMVASLTLIKSAYRLGETVNGSVVINSGDGRVLRISARLETHELVETSIATKSAPQLREVTRRLHAEHHETTLDSARVGFALSIPSGATPDFATSGVKLQWSVRMSFLVIPPSPDAPAPALPSKANGRSSSPAPTPPAKPATHGRSKSFAYGFEPAVPLTLPAAPTILPTGATHLMPVSEPLDPLSSHTSYRAVPDLGFVPVLFSSSTPVAEPLPSPGPLQRSVRAGSHMSTPSLSSVSGSRAPLFATQPAVVLVPAKVETVECSIPIKVYPGNTPFRPTILSFSA